MTRMAMKTFICGFLLILGSAFSVYAASKPAKDKLPDEFLKMFPPSMHRMYEFLAQEIPEIEGKPILISVQLVISKGEIHELFEVKNADGSQTETVRHKVSDLDLGPFLKLDKPWPMSRLVQEFGQNAGVLASQDFTDEEKTVLSSTVLTKADEETHASAIVTTYLIGHSLLAKKYKEGGFDQNLNEERKNLLEGIRIASSSGGTELGGAQKAYSKADQALRKGDIDEAIRQLRKALKIDPNFVDALDDLGLLYKRLNRTSMAKDLFLRSLKLKPDNWVARMNLASAHLHDEEYREAIKHYEILRKSDPDNPEGHYGLGVVRLRQKRSKDALPHMEKALAIYKKTESSYLEETQKMVDELRAMDDE